MDPPPGALVGLEVGGATDPTEEGGPADPTEVGGTTDPTEPSAATGGGRLGEEAGEGDGLGCPPAGFSDDSKLFDRAEDESVSAIIQNKNTKGGTFFVEDLV